MNAYIERVIEQVKRRDGNHHEYQESRNQEQQRF